MGWGLCTQSILNVLQHIVSSSSFCVFSSLMLCSMPFGDGAMDDGGRHRIDLAASSSCSARRLPLSDGR